MTGSPLLLHELLARMLILVPLLMVALLVLLALMSSGRRLR